MLKKLRVIIASLFFVLLTLLFLDTTGTLNKWFGWLAKVQLVPAILAINIAVIILLVVLTIIFGRIYCSVICPLGIFQDGISHIAVKRKGKKNRFKYSPAISWLRYSALGIFVIAIIAGVSIIVSLLDPYAAYGRIASNLLSPLYRSGQNILASFAESIDSYAFNSTEIWIKGWMTFGIAVITLIVVTVLAWKNGRTYCNTICPVGTVLGFLSKFSVFRIVLDADKCKNCKACEFGCKASCIDVQTESIDYSRCVTCFNCTGKCKYGAIKYTLITSSKKKKESVPENVKDSSISKSADSKLLAVAVDKKNKHNGISRRHAFSIAGAMAVGSAIKAQQQLQADGGLAPIEDKKAPSRETPVVPPGALGLSNMKKRCTACQLCVSSCPNNVLRPSDKLGTFMQPEMSFERGYCRPECVECSLVCPSGAISAITTADKSAISIGYAVWIKDSCIVNADEVPCNNCERHCPTTAITFTDRNPGVRNSLKIPVINKELCIGCGACESLCPSRPFSAIYIEGNVRHHLV